MTTRISENTRPSSSTCKGFYPPDLDAKLGEFPPLFPLELGPLESNCDVWGAQLGGLGSTVSPAGKHILVYFELKSGHLVVSVLMTFHCTAHYSK